MKIIKWLIIIVLAGSVGWLTYVQIEYNNFESKFYNIQLPENLKVEKPEETISDEKIDLISENIQDDTILVVGTGYSGYNFYYWHKPQKKGLIYIRAFEITQNTELSKEKLFSETTKEIESVSDEFKLYKANSLIYEGTFEKYYPVRFELWFQPEGDNKPIKLAETKYLIDGWDR
jgi:hypothetical protein